MMWLAVTTLELIGAVGSLAAVAALLVPLSGRVLKGRGTTIAPITLELSRSLWEDDRLSFKVYHVRDGKDPRQRTVISSPDDDLQQRLLNET